jgi:hypothetical protein
MLKWLEVDRLTEIKANYPIESLSQRVDLNTLFG